jgi:DNA-directed RNA polymerase subunit H (RpoH/RPB5)
MINVKKTKEMSIALKSKEPLHIYNETIERVTQFTYLGSIIDNTGGKEGDIVACIRKAQTAFSALNKI